MYAFRALRRQYDGHRHQYDGPDDAATVSSRLYNDLAMETDLLFRISAMYPRKPWVVGGVAVAFCIEFGVNAWLLSHGIGTCAILEVCKISAHETIGSRYT